MPIANFEYPINLYNESISIEDWLCNFHVVVEKHLLDTQPPERTTYPVIIGVAEFIPTPIGEQLITREMIVAMFTEPEVRKQELDAALHYLENLEDL